MATANVIRRPVDDSAPSQPARPSWQRAPADIYAAYDVCEEITRAEARDRYSAIEHIDRSPTDVLRGRISLPAPAKAQIAATALTAKQPSRTPPDRSTATIRLVRDRHEAA